MRFSDELLAGHGEDVNAVQAVAARLEAGGELSEGRQERGARFLWGHGVTDPTSDMPATLTDVTTQADLAILNSPGPIGM